MNPPDRDREQAAPASRSPALDGEIIGAFVPPEPDVAPLAPNTVLSDRALVALTLLLAAMLVVVAVVSLVVWHTPALHAIPVPSVGRA